MKYSIYIDTFAFLHLHIHLIKKSNKKHSIESFCFDMLEYIS